MRLCAAGLALLLGAAALAAENVRLVYVRETGAESCPDEPEVRRSVAARLGYDPFVDGPGRVVRVVLSLAARRLRASIEITDESGDLLGTNQLSPRVRDCGTLASAIELAIALAIDPLHASGPLHASVPLRTGAPLPPPPSPSPDPPPPPLPAMVTHPAAPTVVVRPRRSDDDLDDERGAHLVGRLAIVGAVASAPNATWGVELGLGAQWRRFSLGGELRGDLPGARVTPGGTVASSLVLVSLLPCVRAYGFSFCGVLSSGVMIAYGADFAIDKRVALPFAAGGARAAFEFRLTRRLAVGLHADLLAPFTRELLKVDDQVVYRAEPVSGAFGALVSGVLR
jgi:hypothetical protein